MTQGYIKKQLLIRTIIFGIVALVFLPPAKRFIIGLHDHVQNGMNEYFQSGSNK